MNIPSICLVEVDSGATGLDVIAAALTKQFTTDFPSYWNVAGTFRAATAAKPLLDSEWAFYLHNLPSSTDPTGALAYHYRTPAGLPAGNIFAGLCAQYGDPLPPTIGHEGAEALADPYLHRSVQDGKGTFWALEVCDAVEGDTYDIDGIPMTNFCTPAWFEPPAAGATGTQFDMMGLCSSAFQVRPNGGYAQPWDPTKGWTTVGTMRPYRAHLARLGLARGSRRAPGATP